MKKVKAAGESSKVDAKYGQWAAGILEIHPRLKFPGHFSCGMMGLKFSNYFS